MQVSDGVILSFTNEGSAYDYAAMRAAQLAALSSVLLASSEMHSEETRNNVTWLLADLAQEVSNLLPIVLSEISAKTFDKQHNPNEARGAHATKS